MSILYETEKLILEHEYELACLTEKSTGKVLFQDHFYGDPECGLIDENNTWAIIAGEHLAIWTPNESKIFNDEGIKRIHSIRMKDPSTIILLFGKLIYKHLK